MRLFHRKEQKESIKVQKEEPVQQTYLKNLPGNNQKLYEALSNFLLADPERQVFQLGTVNSFISKGDVEKANGNNLMACVNYEIAARVEIYKQNKDSVTKCLTLADEVFPKETHKTILANMDEVLRIAREYHGRK